MPPPPLGEGAMQMGQQYHFHTQCDTFGAGVSVMTSGTPPPGGILVTLVRGHTPNPTQPNPTTPPPPPHGPMSQFPCEQSPNKIRLPRPKLQIASWASTSPSADAKVDRRLQLCTQGRPDFYGLVQVDGPHQIRCPALLTSPPKLHQLRACGKVQIDCRFLGKKAPKTMSNHTNAIKNQLKAQQIGL